MRPEFSTRIYRHATIAFHQHDYSCSIRIGKNKFAVKPGDVTLTPSHTISCYRFEPLTVGRANQPLPTLTNPLLSPIPAAATQGGFHWCIHFDPPAGSKKIPLPLHLHTGAAAAYIAERMEQIAHLQRMADMNRRSSSALFTAAASAALSALLLWLAVFAGERKSPGKGRIEPAMVKLQKIIDQRLRERLSVAALAREIGLSQAYLAQHFRQRFGMTLQRYLLSRRIEMARNLLLSTELPVKAVAWECGIPDQQYFNKQFRRICGSSPSQFRHAG